MAKSKSSEALQELEAPKTKSPINNIIVAKIKELASIKAVKAIIMVFFTAMAWHFAHAEGASTAMLYLIADNAKKSGRADGNVYMRNGRIRGFKVPALVRNAYTSAARANLASRSAEWEGLSDTDRLTWVNATGVSRSNRFGQPVEVKGKQLYCLMNCNLINAGEATVSAFPGYIAPDALTDLAGTAAVAGGTNSISFTPTPTGSNYDMLVYMTQQQKAGIYRPSNSKYRLVLTMPGGTSSPISVLSAYATKFGLQVAGQKMFVRVIMINKHTGAASAAAECNYIVAA